MPKTIVVLGARNLGGAIVDHFQGLGWNTAAVAQSQAPTQTGSARRTPAGGATPNAGASTVESVIARGRV